MKNLAWAALALLVAFLAGCGGGGGNSVAPQAAGGGPSAPSAPSSGGGTTTFSATDTVAIPTPAPGATSVPVPMPSASGASATVSLSSSETIPADTTIDATLTSSVDSSLPSLSRPSRRVASARGTREGITAQHKVLGALHIMVSANLSLAQAPGLTFTIPGYTPVVGATYWLAFRDPLRNAAGWQLGWEGPATLTATTTPGGAPATTFAFASNGQPLNLVAGQSYWIALYVLEAGAASPTPVPSSVPTNAPSDAPPAPVTASPSAVFFPAVTSSPVPITFSQTGFTGSFTLHGDCTGIINTSGSSPTFTLTPVAQGRCVVIGLGDRGKSAVVHVGVVTAPETPHPYPSYSPNPSYSPTPHPSESPEPVESESPKPSPSPSASPISNASPPAGSTEPSPSPSTSPSPAATRT